MLTRRTLLQSTLLSCASLAGIAACQSAASFRLGVHPWIGYESFYLAEELGKLPSQVKLVHYSNNTEKLQPMLTGQLDAGAFTLDEVIQLQSQGIDLTLVALLNISSGADVVLVKPNTKPPFIHAEQRIAYEANQVGQLMLDLLLNHVGLKRDQVRLYPIPVGESQIEAWQQGKVDVVITFEPTASKLKRLGAQIAYTSRDFPQRIFDVLAVRTDRLRQHHETIKNLVKQHFIMLQRLQDQPDDSLYRIASRQKISYEEAKLALHGVILPSLNRNHQLLGDKQGAFQQSIAHVFDLLNQHQHNALPDNLRRLDYTTAYLPSLTL